MQVLIPTDDFERNATVLQDEQLLYAIQQIDGVLKGLMAGIDQPQLHNDPAVRQWRGHPGALAAMGVSYALEWMIRGNESEHLRSFMEIRKGCDGEALPAWWGGEVHEAHQSWLIRTHPSLYRESFPDVSDDIPMVYPGRENEVFTKNREVVRLTKAADRAQEAAARARQQADDAVRKALAEPESATAPNTKAGNNGWR